MKDNKNLQKWNAYFWDDNPKKCFKNKLNIRTPSKLEKVEKYEIVQALKRLNEQKFSSYSSDLWLKIHKELFGHLYSWAGSYRDVNMEKWNTPYLSCESIKGQLNNLDRFLKSKNFMKDDSDIDHYVKFYSELQRIHPFREGNTRSSKIYMNFLSQQNGFFFNWNEITPEANQLMKRKLHTLNDDSMLRTILNNIKVDQEFLEINNFGIDNAAKYEWIYNEYKEKIDDESKPLENKKFIQ